MSPRKRVKKVTKTTRVDTKRGVFMISVAAELAEMHPQTLRMYEARGLITPQRSPGQTRLYSQSDVDRLRRIQRMTDEGLNLAGVETVLEMEAKMDRMRAELERMRRRAAEAERRMAEEMERLGDRTRTDLVVRDADAVTIPVERAREMFHRLGGMMARQARQDHGS